MTEDGQHTVPTWAPRVRPEKVRRLYALDAQGIYDDDLIMDVGYGLLARCESFIQAVAATRGRARCPSCGAVVAHEGDKEALLQCDCGWSLSWGAYFATIQHKQLSGAEPVLALFGEFVERFPKARTPQARMILIDTLLHGFHWFLKTGEPTRPVAVNLIEMRLGDVIRFLDALSYGEGSTPGTQDKKAEWDERVQNALSWGL
jgi:ribosomal protein L37AE/L43A